MTAVVNPKGTMTLTYPVTAIDGTGATVTLPRSDIVAVEVTVDDSSNQAEYPVTGTNLVDTFDISAQLKGLALGAHGVTAAVKTAEGVVGSFSASFPIVEAVTPGAPSITLK